MPVNPQWQNSSKATEEESETNRKTETLRWLECGRERGRQVFWKLGHMGEQWWCFVLCWMEYRDEDWYCVLILRLEERANTSPPLHPLPVCAAGLWTLIGSERIGQWSGIEEGLIHTYIYSIYSTCIHKCMYVSFFVFRASQSVGLICMRVHVYMVRTVCVFLHIFWTAKGVCCYGKIIINGLVWSFFSYWSN